MENEAEEENVPKDWNIFLEILSSIYDREMQPLYLNSLITEKKTWYNYNISRHINVDGEGR